MEIKKQEEDLFEKWRVEQQFDKFIKDGVIDEETWEKERIKICFVLKDANGLSSNPDACNDLRKFLREGGSSTYWKTWNNVARFTKALLDDEEQYPRDISRDFKNKYLSRICALNLKKEDGKATANDQAIKDYTIRDAALLREQLDIYKPDIIICCGRGEGKNADLLYDHVFNESERSGWSKEPIQGISNGKPVNINYFYTKFEEKEKQTPVISFFHPQRTGGSHALFSEWYEIMRTIKRELLI